MSAKSPPPPDFDDDAPELTDEQIKRLRPASDYFAELGIPMPTLKERPPSGNAVLKKRN